MSRLIQTLQYYYYRQPATKIFKPDVASIGGGTGGGAPSTAGEPIGLALILTKAA